MKTALVTGGSRGIGAACVRALAEDGCRVVVNYVKEREKAEALARETGGEAFRADVSVEAEAKALVEAAGEPDVLVCCAGISFIKLFQDTTAEEWRRVFAVNVEGTANVCRFAVPGMIRKKSGCIVTVSSMWGQVGASCETAYSASKAAVIGLTRALAKELGPSGVRVNCLAPGVVMTDMNAELSPETLDALRGETPLNVLGEAGDIAGAVRFLASDAAKFITGQVLAVNGGLVI
ncbi:MAG: 3-oxoacyl-ACP reductase FabG [Oscillospiraceae bacterium]|nr:3-oxoacyl-ACP reductase FabG [Oscillospiraceae bacterium]